MKGPLEDFPDTNYCYFSWWEELLRYADDDMKNHHDSVHRDDLKQVNERPRQSDSRPAGWPTERLP